jgi:putative transposase
MSIRSPNQYTHMIPQYRRDRGRYDSDLSDAQWELVQAIIPASTANRRTGGRPPAYDRREILDAILYVARTGCQWRLLPHDLPPWKTVYTYFVRWHNAGVFEAANTRLRKDARIAAGRNAEPTAGVIDSQSVKIVANIGFAGFDGAKKVNGRKRHIVTDTLGLLLTVVVHEASLSDRAGAEQVLALLKLRCKKMRTIFADQGYTGSLIATVKATLRITIEIIKRNQIRTFHILPRRWVVERTFGWFGFYRRLAKDYERYPSHSEAFVYIAMTNIMLHRLARGY